MNFFQISLLIITLAIIFFTWKKYRLIANFFIGILTLIALSNLDFLDFEGNLDVFTISHLIFSFILLSLTMLIPNKKQVYIFSILVFLLITFFLLFGIDSGKYFERKFGVIIRVFLAFFPINYWYLLRKED